MSDDLPPLAIFLMGPTASGKTAVALALHDELPVEIISVDSSQIYRGMDIGTAKPTAAELHRAPHQLIDIRDPKETYSAAEFRNDALREMHRITATGKIPLLVGGTMFYFRVLEYGLSPLPAAAPQVRARLTAEAQRIGWPEMHRRLAAIDPPTAARLDPHDAQRIQRALEVHAVTGLPASGIAQAAAPDPIDYRLYKIALWPDDRAVLHARIAARFRQMLERGLVAEVEGLYGRGDLDAMLPSMRAVGYRQVWSYLTGRVNYNQMIEQSIAATRQLAKRQLTWLRRYPGAKRVECGSELPLREVIGLVRRIV